MTEPGKSSSRSSSRRQAPTRDRARRQTLKAEFSSLFRDCLMWARYRLRWAPWQQPPGIDVDSTRSVRQRLPSREVGRMCLTEARPTGCSYAEVHGHFWTLGSGGVDQLDAAELLGVGERSFRRWCRCATKKKAAGSARRRAGGCRWTVRGRAFVSDALSGLHRAAFPRAPGSEPPVRLGLLLDERLPAKPEPVAEGPADVRQVKMRTAGRACSPSRLQDESLKGADVSDR